MKKLIFIAMLFIFCNSYAQKRKSIDIYRNSTVSILGSVSFNESGEPVDTVYMAFAQDKTYQYIVETITISYGDLNEVYNFFKYAKDFLIKEEDGTREKTLSVVKILGVKQLWIYDEDGGSGYSSFGVSGIEKIIKAINSWATKNNITL